MRLDVRAPELHHHTGGFKGQHGDIAARQASRRVHARSTGPQARGLFTRPSHRPDKDKTQPTLLAEAAQWGSSQLDFGSGIRIGIDFHRRIPIRIPIRIPFSILPGLGNPL